MSSIVGSGGKPSSFEVTLDFGRLNFIDGSGYTVLSNSIEWMLYHGTNVRFINFERVNNFAIQYLDDCGFFYYYGQRYLRVDAKVRSTTLPCMPIEQTKAFGWIESKLSPWLGYIFDANKSRLSSIRTCVKEVINNISDHSTMNTGFVHAQHYPNAKQVKITMSDFGAGIPNTIRNRYGVMPDHEAIIHATKEGITAKSRPNNMGAGLSYLVDTVLGNRGVVRFHSLSGNLTCLCDTKGKRVYHARSGTGVYPGTLIEIEIDTRLFVGDEDDERGELEW
jgi:anti-sigma regulatory factor (Ser/Thr protein kinase)